MGNIETAYLGNFICYMDEFLAHFLHEKSGTEYHKRSRFPPVHFLRNVGR